MKKVLLLVALATLIAAPAFAGITGSKHDFSQTYNVGATGGQAEICIFCHTPHGAATIATAPLWNHNPSSATYKTYVGSATFDASNAGAGNNPGAISKLCLSCHDGTVGVDSLQPASVSAANAIASGESTLIAEANGTDRDLSNDHPIGFTYDDTLAGDDGGLYTPSNTDLKDASGTVLGKIANEMLFAGKLECASCHDVHNDKGNAFLLLVSNDKSHLCLSCHNK